MEDPKPKMGRPVKEIDFNDLDKLCYIQATQREVASFFEVSEDTIDRRIKERFGMTFAEYTAQKKDKGKISLRRAQYQKAVDEKNPTMMIWLGKQYLGQTDKLQHSGDDDKPLMLTYKIDDE